MSHPPSTDKKPPDHLTAKWGAVFALSFSVISLVTAEMLPISLLTPVASALHVSEGMAGQAVSATSIIGTISSLFIASATRRLDRRLVMLMFMVFFIASNALVSMATDFTMLIIGRVILGVALGGFWSMAAAITMRLVPAAQIPRALSIIFGGVSVAMAISAPVGTWLGSIIVWRGVFASVAIIGVVGLVWQYRALPAMKPSGQSKMSTLFSLLKKPQIGIGMLGMALVFGVHFAFFTYLRPSLENVAGFWVKGVSTLLFGFGVASIAGTSFAGNMLRRSLRLTLALVPLCMSALAFAFIFTGHVTPLVSLWVVIWGFLFGAVPVAWTTWLTDAVPEETESGGGLQVAAIQLAITAAAGLGGLLIDSTGAYGAIAGSGIILLIASLLILSGIRPEKQRKSVCDV